MQLMLEYLSSTILEGSTVALRWIRLHWPWS